MFTSSNTSLCVVTERERETRLGTFSNPIDKIPATASRPKVAIATYFNRGRGQICLNVNQGGIVVTDDDLVVFVVVQCKSRKRKLSFCLITNAHISYGVCACGTGRFAYRDHCRHIDF